MGNIVMRALVPAGLIGNVVELPQDGAIARYYGGRIGTGVWLATGEQVFIKLYVPAELQSRSIPRKTPVVGEAMLRHLRNRLATLHEHAKSIPSARIYFFDRSEASLCLVMEKVLPISKVLTANGNIALACKVLSDLSPVPDEDGRFHWVHFDICPDNVAVRSDGCVCLIDLDSFFFSDDAGEFDIAVPLCKIWRTSRRIREEMGNQPSATVLARRQELELMLVAAECSLGAVAAVALPNECLDDWIGRWLDLHHDNHAELVDFWTNQFLLACEDMEKVDLSTMAYELGQLDDRIGSAGPLSVAVVASKRLDATDVGEIRACSDPLTRFGPRLRAGLLTADDEVAYWDSLTSLVSRDPNNEDAWHELLLVAVAYLRDAGSAASVVADALKAFPGNKFWLDWRIRIVRWAEAEAR